jgi:hypothetical protein
MAKSKRPAKRTSSTVTESIGSDKVGSGSPTLGAKASVVDASVGALGKHRHFDREADPPVV